MVQLFLHHLHLSSETFFISFSVDLRLSRSITVSNNSFDNYLALVTTDAIYNNNTAKSIIYPEIQR